MGKYSCIGFNIFILKGNSFLDHTNLFCPNKYEVNDKIILAQVQQLEFKISIH